MIALLGGLALDPDILAVNHANYIWTPQRPEAVEVTGCVFEAA
jgi:hypothetical protein